LGKVCLIGCAELQINEVSRTIEIGETTLREGDLLTLDGNEGVLYAGAIRTEIEYPVELLTRLASLRQRCRAKKIGIAPNGKRKLIRAASHSGPRTARSTVV